MEYNKKCSDCKKDFLITDEQQEFCARMGYPIPVRCKDCKKAKNERMRTYEKRKRSPFAPLLSEFKKGGKYHHE